METSDLSQLANRINTNLRQRHAGPVGVDVVPLDTFSGVDLGDPALRENFSQEELDYAGSRPDVAASLAGAWAVKEAFLKALGAGLVSGHISPHEVVLRHNQFGVPKLHLAPEVARRLGVAPEQVQMSLTHGGGVAVAVLALPGTTPRVQAPASMPKTGGIKNYEKGRAEIVDLLRGVSSSEAPPPPLFAAEGEAHGRLIALADDPELAPVFALARRCGIDFRVVAPHPEAFDNLDNAEESNDFRKLAPYAQLHFLALTLDQAAYDSLDHQAPLPAGARGVVLVNEGLLHGPEELSTGRELLLRSELLHEVVHFEDPGFEASEELERLQREWFQETAGIARQLTALAQAAPERRALAEGLITDTLEGNPIKGSFDLQLGDGSMRRIASKTFMVLEMELSELQRVFGTLTPDGMNPALFRLLDRVLDDESLFHHEQLSFSDQGLEELLRYVTRQDRDFRREVKREMGSQRKELVPPADGATRVREVLQRTEELLAGRTEPSFDEPVMAPAQDEAAAVEASQPPAAGVPDDPYLRQRRRRAEAMPPAPSRGALPPYSVLLQRMPQGRAHADGVQLVLDLRRARVSSEELQRVRRDSLQLARDLTARGTTLALRLAREPEQALEEIGSFLPELKDAITDVVLDAESPEEVWLVDDELTELEQTLGLPTGSVGIQVTLSTPTAVNRLERIVRCTPRVSAVELGATLPAQMGWVFRERPGERAEHAVRRRIDEAERAMEACRELARVATRAAGLQLIRGPVTLAGGEALAPVLGQLRSDYDVVRLVGAEQLGLVAASETVAGELEQRLQSLERSVFDGASTDPDAAFRLEEDLRVLELAVERRQLQGEPLERYWRARWAMLFDRGVPAQVDVPATSLPEALLTAARRHPQRGILYRAERTSAGGVAEQIRSHVPFVRLLGPDAYRVARVLQRLGVDRGDRVALSTSNTLAHVATFQAVGLLGAVLVPLDPTKGHLADRFFNDAEVKLLVFDSSQQSDDTELHHARLLAWAREQGLDEEPAFWEELLRARRKLGGPQAAEQLEALSALVPDDLRAELTRLWQRRVDAVQKFAETLPRVPSLQAVLLTRMEDLVPELPPGEVDGEADQRLARALGPGVTIAHLSRLLPEVTDEPIAPGAGPDDFLAWPYTGGTTTGVSKAVGHTHRSMLALGIQRGITMIPPGSPPDQVVATTLPFTHTYGFATGVLTPVLMGADALVVPTMGARYLPSIAEGMVEQRATVLFSSRSALATLARLIPETAELTGLQRIASSGDTLTSAVTELWRERFGITPCSGYGSTETPSSLMNPLRTNRAGTEGIPVPNVEARIVDADSGEPLPPGRPGLLQLRGPHLASCYVGRPEADAKSKREGGWWQKDDIFKMDRDGYFIFCGRADDMFTVNELNVYPDAVEQALLTIDGVAEVGVIGVFDDNLGTNRVKAMVVPQPGATLTPEQVIEAARPLLEAHEVPSLVELTESLARSNFGKLSRSALRKSDAARADEEQRGADAEPAITAPAEVPRLVARESLLVFPTGGTHWPGMGADLDRSPSYQRFVARAERALADLGVPDGALRRLMQGTQQAERVQGADGWSWRGDFPLSVAAQTVLGVSLANAFVLSHGSAAAVVGESMGEVAAYCVSGALELEQAVVLAYRWAEALQRSSDQLGLRMAVVENLDRDALHALVSPLGGGVVIEESPTLFVVALPTDRLPDLERAAGEVGARALVSNNPCAAHEPRLRETSEIWDDYAQLVGQLDLRPPVLPLLSTLSPGSKLRTPDELRQNLLATVHTPLHWRESLEQAVDAGARTLVQLGTNAAAYALEKLRSESPLLEGVRIDSVGTLAGVELLDAAPGRCWTGMPVVVSTEGIRALARASGDRNLYHLDLDYARRTRYGEVILHGVGTEGIVLAEAGRRFPSMQLVSAEVPSFKQPVKLGDTVKPVVEVQAVEGNRVTLRLMAVNGWGDLIFEGSATMTPAEGPLPPQGGEVDLESYGRDVEPFAERPAPDYAGGEREQYTFELDAARIGATRKLFPGGNGAFAAALGIELVSFASASFAPGFVLTGTRVLDALGVLGNLWRALSAAEVDQQRLEQAVNEVDESGDTDTLLATLALSRRAQRTVARTLSPEVRQLLDRLLQLEGGRATLLATWRGAHQPLRPGRLTVVTALTQLQGSSPERSIEIEMQVTDEQGRLLVLGGVSKTESPPATSAEQQLSEEEQLAATLVQQKIINVFPVTRPRDAENSAADPAVNAALVDLEDAVSPTMRREARPRAVEMFGRVRRHAPRVMRGLVVALQTARARLKSANLGDALLDPAVRDFEGLMARLEFRKRGADDFRKAMKRPQQRLLKTYLSSACTRRALLEAVGQLDFGGKVLKLRPNNVRTDAAAADYFDVVRHVGNRIDALTIPKTRFPVEIVTIDRVLTAIERDRGWPVGRIKLELLIEHPMAVQHLDAIAAASPRIISLIYGHVDYVAATRGWEQNFQFEFQRYAKARTVEAAHENGQIAIDAITPAINPEAARRDAEQSVAMGFDGKWSIHLDHIVGIRQVAFPPPKLRLRAHTGAAEFTDGLFDLDRLGAVAAEGQPLDTTPLPRDRERLLDLRAVRRLTPDQLSGLSDEQVGLYLFDLRGRQPDDRLAHALRDLGPRGGVLLGPDADLQTLKLVGGVAHSLMLEAATDGPALDTAAVVRAAETFPGRLLLGLTRDEEVEQAFQLASASNKVVALVNGVARADQWETSGALVCATSALGIDALQGIDTDDGWQTRAFRTAHMGISGQVAAGAEQVEALHQAYTPRADLISEAAAIVERYYKAERIEHLGAIPYEFTYLQQEPTRGLVDAATAKIYNGVIERAWELGLLTPEQQDIRRCYVQRWHWNDSGEDVDFTRWEWDPDREGRIRTRDGGEQTATLGQGPGQFSPTAEL